MFVCDSLMWTFDGFKSVSCGVDTTGAEAAELGDKVVVGGNGDVEAGVETRYADIEFDDREGTKNALDAENPKNNTDKNLKQIEIT